VAVVRSAIREQACKAPLVLAYVEDMACGPASEQAVVELENKDKNKVSNKQKKYSEIVFNAPDGILYH
jgi:hypothetical protein